MPMPEPSIKTAVATPDGVPPRRQCGRCRAFFAAEPDADPRLLAGVVGVPTVPCRAVPGEGSAAGLADRVRAAAARVTTHLERVASLGLDGQ